MSRNEGIRAQSELQCPLFFIGALQNTADRVRIFFNSNKYKN